jgi:hypothetical protein
MCQPVDNSASVDSSHGDGGAPDVDAVSRHDKHFTEFDA